MPQGGASERHGQAGFYGLSLIMKKFLAYFAQKGKIETHN